MVLYCPSSLYTILDYNIYHVSLDCFVLDYILYIYIHILIFRYPSNKTHLILQIICDRSIVQGMDQNPIEYLCFQSTIQLPVFNRFIKFALWPSFISVRKFTFLPTKLIDSYYFRHQDSTVLSPGLQSLNQVSPFAVSIFPTIQDSYMLHMRAMMGHKMLCSQCSSPCLTFWLVMCMY